MSLIKKLLLLTPIALMAASKPPPPPAGIVERQIESEYEAKEIDPEKEIPLLEIDIPEKQLDLHGESVLIRDLAFDGNEVLSSEELKKVAAPYLNLEISIQEMQKICRAVQKAYAEKGYFLARAYLPEQAIHDGTLKISVLEGKLGKVQVTGNKYYSEKFIAGYFKKYQGKAINYDQFLKTLLLLDENTDLDVGAVFKKGEAFGTADVVIRVHDKRPIHLFVDHNNYGSLHTSRHRTGGRLDWGNLIMYGDTFSIAEVLGSPINKLDFTDVVYRFPVNTYGAFLDFSYLLANFKTKRFDQGLVLTGRSHIASAKFTQALHRTRRLNTDIFTSFDFKQIKNLSHQVGTTSFDKLRVLALGMNIDYIDGWKGRNIFTGAGYFGIPDFLGGLSIIDSQCSRVGAGGLFAKLSGSAKRIQKLPKDCFLLLNGVGQYSFFKLALPEQIYIGGVDTVRGYRLAEGLGDSGYYANAELHVPLPFIRGKKVPFSKKTWGELFQVVGFFDFGHTYSHGEDVLRESEVENGKIEKGHVKQHGHTFLMAAGAGARLHGPWRFDFSFDAGYPLTEKHKSSDTIVYFKVSLQIL